MTQAPARRRPVALLLALLLGASLAGASAFAGSDHEKAMRAVREGRALPLAEILPGIESRIGGRVLEVELEREDGRYFYEFKMVTTSGRLLEVMVDAASGRVVEIEDD
ncbi:PepSY domain-containing protein [Stappia sp. MMSF_3263]|uniref:PepSY domain-containing protein n=1 Tax=Stappia sp. MMSF_3263 TaxID=3046693 RepID=UPI00273F1CFE|nr:PepSY domain-containing protein [Stappia sp. MMSF_3263]